MSRTPHRPALPRRRLLAAAAGGAAAATTLAAAGAAPAGAAPRLRVGEVPLGGRRMERRDGVWTTGRLPAQTFRMLGLTWRGDAAPVVRVRTRRDGDWSAWQRLEVLGDGPDPGTGESGSGRRGTHPLWVGRADGVHVTVEGERPPGLRLALIDPGDLASDARAADDDVEAAYEQAAYGDRAAGARPRRRRAPQPPLRSRRDWGADESLRGSRPVMCRTIQQVHLHHTASGNDYSRAEVPALIRSFYRYHTQSLGWSDIGYNFLVDRFGRTWVGRAGGPGRPVRGAHTLGFNHTSVGIAVIGNYESARATDRVVTAVVRLAAWKLDRYGRRPRGKARVYSKGSDKYAKGWVRLKVIDGHRDTNDTACPGGRLYAKLPEIRRRTHYHVQRHS